MSPAIRLRIAATLSALCLLAVPAGSAYGSASAGSTVSAGPTASSGSAPSADPAAGALPLFAFYYQWFDPSSWNRAKTDYPALGKYSSDDKTVMRQHILWAKAAGINGFIVSWKDTPVNDRRLRELMAVAKSESFSLAMIYQGLDFSRHPLPIARVAADFATFRTSFAPDPVFYRVGGKPLTIWSGTWAYSHADVAKVTGAVRQQLRILSTEKSVAGYQRLADVTDGDAYYWSSVNPDTNPNYGEKLKAMAAAVHRDGHYWIAPFAAGFDARLVGGANTVTRNNGETLRKEYATALTSSPDALGLISWNEFSENTYVEPSTKYGNVFLRVLSQLRNTQPPVPLAAEDSSAPIGGGSSSYWPNVIRIGSFALVLVLGLAWLQRARYRRRKGRHVPPTPTLGKQRTGV